MKVLHLIGGGDVGGAKIHVLSLVKELSKYIDVKIISFRPGVFTDEAKSMGIDIEIVKTGNIFSDIKRVIKIVKEGNYEIIHSHGAKANSIAVFAKYFTKIPTITTVHSDYRLDYLQSIFKKLTYGLLNTIALRFINYHIGVSRNFREMLIERKFNPQNIFTVYNGIDFDKEIPEYSKTDFLKKFKLDLNDDDIIIGILARLHPVKGLDTFIEAANEVLKQAPTVKFIIGGDGEQRKSLEKKVAALGIEKNVLFLGWVEGAYEFMSSIDINVMTSLSESFPYTILEGVRLQKATISSDVGGISDLIDSGENGYLFKVGDYKTLANYMLTLINDSSKRKELGDKLYQKARSKFSLDNMCNTQLEIYSSVHDKSRLSNGSKRSSDVIISGYYGLKNIGDDAILLAIVNNLRKLKKDIRITVLSKDPTETKIIYGVDSINRINLFQILWFMKSSKLFISGGGTLIQDSTSTRSLIYYLGTIWLAKKLGLKTMVYASGIGPININSNRRLAKRVINRVDVITLREETSKLELDNLRIDKPLMSITADPAIAIEAARQSEIDHIFLNECADIQGPFIGFSVRWGEMENYGELVAKAADYVSEKYNLKPVFLPMQYPRDLKITESIVAKMKNKGYIMRSKYNPQQMIGIISRMEMLIGMRLHALIFAAGLGIPVIGLVYDPKVERFLQYINQETSVNVKQLDLAKLKSTIDDVWNNRENISKQLKEITNELKNKALEDAKIAIELMDRKA